MGFKGEGILNIKFIIVEKISSKKEKVIVKLSMLCESNHMHCFKIQNSQNPHRLRPRALCIFEFCRF